MILETEFNERLQGIESGSWMKGVRHIRKMLPPLDVDLIAHLDDQVFSLEPVRAKDLNFDTGEFAVRVSLIQVLTLFQLYELAIRTEYLPSYLVRERARRLFAEFFRVYQIEDFFLSNAAPSVSRLAHLLEIEGFSFYPLTQQSSGTDTVKFAGVLAHLNAFYSDMLIRGFMECAYLNVWYSQDIHKIAEYFAALKNGIPKKDKDLFWGTQRFLNSLAVVFKNKKDRDVEIFGSIYLVILMAFFGYRWIEGDGRRLDPYGERQERNKSWGSRLHSSLKIHQAFFAPDSEDYESKSYYRELSNNVIMLKKVLHRLLDLRLEAENEREEGKIQEEHLRSPSTFFEFE